MSEQNIAVSPNTTRPDATAHMLQSMIDVSNSVIAYWETVRDNGRVTDFVCRLANQAMYDLVRRSADQVLGHIMTELFPSVKEIGLFDQYAQVVETGQPQEFEFHYQADGYQNWYLYTSKPLGEGVVLSFVDITSRKQNEAQQQKQADQLQFVMNSALTAISLYSILRDPLTGRVVDLRYELLNQMAERMTGRKATDLVGRTMLDVFPGIQASGVWMRYQELAESGVPLRYQNHYTYDGYDLWYEVQGVRRDDYIVLSFLDITELKTAQAEQQQQADEFRQILDNALTAISLFEAIRDEKGQIVDFVYKSFNQTSELMTGRKAEEIIGHRMLELFPGVQTSGVFDRWVKLMETGGSVRFQDYFAEDGFDFWFDTQAVKWHDGFIQSYIDITSIKQAELDKQRHADLLTSLLAVSPVAFAHYEAIRNDAGLIVDFRFRLANQAAADIVSLSVDEVLARTATEINPDLPNSEVFNHYVTVVQTGQPMQFERFLRNRWFQVSLVKFDDGFVSAFVDISQSHLYQEQLEGLNAELRRSNDNLQQFAYVASHDLQEPLRKIQAFGDLVVSQYGPSLDENGRNLISRMQNAAGRMSVLIRDLLTYSRLSIMQEPFGPVSLADLVNDVLDDLELTLEQTGARVDVGPLPKLTGDQSQLRQLFQNLLANALKFRKTDTPPVVTISSRQVSGAELPPVLTTSKRMYYEIRVSDNGIGFDPQYKERIFGVFQRLHNRSQYEGTGVGLAICRRMVENHGGYITGEGRPGEGATFLVYLPA
ncbi:PAS domain-containing protein [Spirosoma taeanense]|uniref:histidine kinase n=1 Tax=Spirosoma taeanense TaxID=2735870 RepID=A0A6M5YEQ7_9BACT|nr:PAS domain-containing protein [Spirosoma taeanense]QJW91763.1 PAS domain-containing protein [Spirosoma taeanense]